MTPRVRSALKPPERRRLYPISKTARFSRRQTALRHAVRSVRFQGLVACLEMVGVLSSSDLGAHSIEDVSLAFLFCQLEDRRLRALLQNRSQRRGPYYLPKSRHWSQVVLDALRDDLWQSYVRMDRGAYS